MLRRDFLKILGLASAGAAVAYSFPEIIVPKNIVGWNGVLLRISDNPEYGFGFSGFQELNVTTLKEIYPLLIDDLWFKEDPNLVWLRNRMKDFDNGIFTNDRPVLCT